MALAMAGGANSVVFAQTLPAAGKAVPDDGTRTAQNAAPDESEAGQWVVVPALSTGLTYDSNVFATPDQPRGDLFLTVTPSLMLRKQGDGRRFAVEAVGTAARYRNNSRENSRDFRLDASGSQRINAYGNVFGGLGVSRAHEDRTSPDDVFGTRPTVFTDAHAHAGITQRWSSLSLRTGATYDHLLFRNVPNADGGVINNRDRNRDVLGVGLRIGYALSPRTDLFVQGTLDRRRYEHTLDDYGYRRSSQGDSWVVGLARRGSAPLTGEIYLGERAQRYDDPRLPDVSLPTAGANLQWTTPDRTSVSAFYERSIQETTLPGASSYVDSTVGVRADRPLGGRLSTHASLSFTRSDFRGIVRRDDIFDAGVGLSYRLARHVRLDADYRLLQRHSDLREADYYRHEVYLGVRMDGGAAPLDHADGSAMATDAPAPADAPSGFYIGTALGYDVLDTRVAGIRGEHGTYRGDFAGRGRATTLFAGYGHAFGRLYLGVEADGTRSHAGWNHDKSPDSRVYLADLKHDEGLALQAGYVLPDAGLAFASIGRRRATFETSYTPESTVTYLQRDRRMGTSYGVGLDTPLSAHLFLRARYDITRYGYYDVDYDEGIDRFAGSVGRFQLGLGWRLGGVDATTPSTSDADGFYAGAQAGDDRSGSLLDAVHRQAGPPAVTEFRSDFGGRGNDAGAFTGYGHSFGGLYTGVEIEGDASRTGWYQAKLPNGRQFSVETRGSYGAAVRLGYQARSGALVYLRAGRVRGRFHTRYVKGNNTDTWVARDDSRAGTRLGVGMEAPLTASTFLRLDYTTTRYAAIAFSTTQGSADDLRFSNRQNLFRIGLGVRF